MSEENELETELHHEAEEGATEIRDNMAVQKKEMRKKFWVGVLCGLVMAMVCVAIFVIAENVYYIMKYRAIANNQAADNYGTTNEGTKSVVSDETTVKMAAIQQLIDKYYYEAVDTKTLEDGIYYGMVGSIGDIYSEYYSPEDLREALDQNEGIYYGIGAYISLDQTTNLPMISGVMSGTPAEEAGFMEGDIIYKVDDVVTTGMSTSEVVKYIKGPEHTFVTVTVIREGETDYLDIEVERRRVETPTIEYEMMENDIGYIQIKEFDDVTLDQFTDAMATLKGQEMKGLILDLRSNPGGNLDTACDIARQILPKGLIVYTEDKYGEKETFECDGNNSFDKPLVVLVNGYSASASEILTGAIKDYGIGTIMGTTTFGKGIVQRIIPMSDGSAVKLTISKYYTPKGTNIHGIGIDPDIVVEYDAEAYRKDKTDNQKTAAYDYILEKIK